MGVGMVYRLPFPEHTATVLTLESGRIGIRAVVAYLGTSVPYAAEALLGIRQVL